MLNPRAPERLVHAAPFGGEPGLLSPRAGPRTRAVVCGGALGLLLGLLAALQPLSHGPPHAQHMSVPRTAPPTAVSPLRAPAVPQSAGGRTPTGTPRRPLVDGGAPATPAASAVEAGAPASAAADQNASPIAALGVALLALGAGLWGYARRGPAPLDGAPAPATSAAVGRRAFAGAGVAAGSALLSAAATAAAEPPTIAFPSGLQVQDFKEGTGPPPRKGTQVCHPLRQASPRPPPLHPQLGFAPGKRGPCVAGVRPRAECGPGAWGTA